jgi:hypothetical protein
MAIKPSGPVTLILFVALIHIDSIMRATWAFTSILWVRIGPELSSFDYA